MNGHRAGISEENEEALREAGLAHLLAISGLHIGLVCGALFFMTRLFMATFGDFALRHPIKKYAAMIALGGGLIYMFLAGATVPTQRAMLMSAVVFAAIMVDRSPISLRLVVFAALIVLAISPYSLLSASFQLSFAAVTALVAFYEALRPAMIEWRRNMSTLQRIAFYFIGVAMTSVIAGLATAPFALYHFQQFASYGVLGNIVAIPIMAFWVMPMAIVSMVAMPFGIEQLPLVLMGAGIGQILDMARFVSSLDGAILHTGAFPMGALLGMAVGLLFFILWQGHLRHIGLLIFAVAFAGIFFTNQPDILVSSSGKLIAMNDSEAAQLRVNTMRKEKFVRENWEQSYGYEKDSAVIIGAGPGQICDDVGCRMTMGTVKIAYSLQPYAHKEDCGWADLVIATDPIFSPCKTRVIDKFDVHRNGAYSVYLNKGNIHLEHVKETILAGRPWNGL